MRSLRLWGFPLPTGNYEVSIKFNDEHIPDSPYLVPVIAPSDDARCLTVMSLQVRRKEASVSLATGRPVRLLDSGDHLNPLGLQARCCQSCGRATSLCSQSKRQFEQAQTDLVNSTPYHPGINLLLNIYSGETKEAC